MKKLAIALAAIVAMAFASGAAVAQRQGGHGGGGSGGGAHAGGGHGGVWNGGAGHGGGWNRGGGHGGGWNGGGWYGGGWRGGWYGPRVGVYVGFPGYWGAWPYPYLYSNPAYYPYYPYSAYVPSEPAVYVHPSTDAAPALTNYWHYCTDPAGYFPYVQNCSKAWMQVVPQRVPNAPHMAPAQ